MIKIAIHYEKKGFSEYWIEYCKERQIAYKIVDCYRNDIVNQLEDCNALMWHHNHNNYKDILFAKQLLFSLQQSGKIVFPDFNTGWHFNDKLGQKYLFESISIPHIPSYIFYDKATAREWASTAIYPKVFKLRAGAGALNVSLVNNKSKASKLINRAFNSGFSQFNRVAFLKDRLDKYKRNKITFIRFCKSIVRAIIGSDYSKMYPKEKGYVYFQDFIPQNNTDYRVKIVDNKCWAFQRRVRKDDFRASGSDSLIFDNTLIPIKMIDTAFKIYHKLNLQCIAFDFLIKDDQPLVVEMSYGFGFDKNEMTNGYWTEDLAFHTEKFNPFGWMVDIVIKKIEHAL
jgi:glutathione synthase/RimK-type ligase-like ATP-grasp enzyme